MNQKVSIRYTISDELSQRVQLFKDSNSYYNDWTMSQLLNHLADVGLNQLLCEEGEEDES